MENIVINVNGRLKLAKGIEPSISIAELKYAMLITDNPKFTIHDCNEFVFIEKFNGFTQFIPDNVNAFKYFDKWNLFLYGNFRIIQFIIQKKSKNCYSTIKNSSELKVVKCPELTLMLKRLSEIDNLIEKKNFNIKMMKEKIEKKNQPIANLNASIRSNDTGFISLDDMRNNHETLV